MTTSPLQLVLITSFALVTLILFFRYERKRGKRFFDSARSHVDFWLLKIRHTFNVRLRNWSRYFIRQIGHYFLHTTLTGTIRTLDGIEGKLKTIAHSNRTLAKKSDKERTHMNKLEEIALHKMEVALSEKEKRVRRQKSLEG